MLLSRLDLPLTIAFVLFHLQFNVFCSKSTSETLSSSTLFSDVIDKKVSILVDPIRVIIERSTNADHDDQLQQNRTFAVDKIQWPPPSTSNTSAALCALSLHRNANCDGPTIGPSERIGWDTRICFRWSCDGAAGTGMAMRVENCWTGSEHSPIELIDHLGCSRRETMISTPVHRHVQRMAKSAGWLTVRLFNTNHIRLSCAIRLCHACDDKCRTKITPNCSTLLRNGKEDERERWRTELEQICTEERIRIQSAATSASSAAESGSTGRRRWLINKMVVMLPSMIINWALSNKLWGRE
uniref:ZP domain-containing protein n=1 Tax=Globodera rostochiensis TaxID=31243 RepID=A0A914HAH7_GLORO